jgi:glycosyltransferase involved in cell wall biosynthesis
VHAETPRILWIAPSDPWSRWTLSGISRETCLELKRRGLLYGALSPEDTTLRHLQGPAPLRGVETKVIRMLRKFRPIAPWVDERDCLIGDVLRQCPAGTIVIYALLRPKIDRTLNIRRFRWMDLSLRDAVNTGSFGYAGMSHTAVDRALADEHRMIASCEGVVALSTYAADSISRDIGVPRDKITPVGAGAALEIQAVPPHDPARYASARILFVGRDWQRKRGDLIVEAFRLLKKRIARATLTIVGPAVAPVAIEEGIHFVGPLDKGNPVERTKLHDLLVNSSVLCMASRSEPWGLVYVEAGLFGLPVVALNDWALPDIVIDGITGRLVQSPTAGPFADALEEVVGNPMRAAAMGRAARTRMKHVLSWSAVIDRMLSRVCPEALVGREVLPLRDEERPMRLP